MSDVQAGGVSGGTTVRRLARAPAARNLPRNGITPRATSGSSTEKVAPSRPINRALTAITPPEPGPKVALR